MVITNLTSVFGKTVTILGRYGCADTHWLAGLQKSYAGEKIREAIRGSNTVAKCDETAKPHYCQAQPQSPFGPESAFSLELLPLTKAIKVNVAPMAAELQSQQNLRNLPSLGHCHIGATKIFNATMNSAMKLFNRMLSTLTVPMRVAAPIMLPLTSQPNRQLKKAGRRFDRDFQCAEWCGEERCKLARKEAVQKPSMWAQPPCYKDTICPKVIRMDIIHMPGSNKGTREYQQTWIDCPEQRIVPKLVCCFDPVSPPPICRRPRQVRPTTAEYCKKSLDCRAKQKHVPLCARIMPCPDPACCKEVRFPPNCTIYPSPKCCRKRCTPYPAFSECCRPNLRVRPPAECYCLDLPTMCQVWEYWRKWYQRRS